MQVALIVFLGASCHHSGMSDDDSRYPSELAERFQVRLPLGMRDRIKAAAEANNRSMNAEIVATLEEKYPAPSPADAIRAAFTELLNTIRSESPNNEMLAKAIDHINSTMDAVGKDTANAIALEAASHLLKLPPKR